MSTVRQSLSSVIYQNLIIPHPGNVAQALFYFSTALLPLRCEVETSQACIVPFLPPVLLLSFTVFNSLFLYQLLYLLLTSCHLNFIFSVFHSALCPPLCLSTRSFLKILPLGVRRIPDIPGSWLVTTKER